MKLRVKLAIAAAVWAYAGSMVAYAALVQWCDSESTTGNPVACAQNTAGECLSAGTACQWRTTTLFCNWGTWSCNSTTCSGTTSTPIKWCTQSASCVCR